MLTRKLRRKWQGKVARATVELSQTLRRVFPSILARWKEFVRTIEENVEEMSLLDAEVKKLEPRANTTALCRTRVKELKRDLQEEGN